MKIALIIIIWLGTVVFYKPGLITGGIVSHDCGTSRGIGYFLEALIWLAPFAKEAMNVSLQGITNEEYDSSVDILRTVTLPLIQRFGVEDIELKVNLKSERIVFNP